VGSNPRHSQQQRDAVIAAVKSGMSAPAVERAAAAGGLGDLGAFKIPASTIRDMVARAREDQAPEQPATSEDSSEVVDAAEARIRRIVDRESRRLEAEEQPDLQKLYWLQKNVHELAGLAKRRQGRQGAGERPAEPKRKKGLGRPWEQRPGQDDDDDVRALIERERAANGNGAIG
jgi:hypothetical protein